uniref:Uncharacterized protein n=1 Tax=Triticum urartu TaxID=4572 RepID=A0A8R7PNB3_TRIUA
MVNGYKNSLLTSTTVLNLRQGKGELGFYVAAAAVLIDLRCPCLLTPRFLICSGCVYPRAAHHSLVGPSGSSHRALGFHIVRTSSWLGRWP